MSVGTGSKGSPDIQSPHTKVGLKGHKGSHSGCSHHTSLAGLQAQQSSGHKGSQQSGPPGVGFKPACGVIPWQVLITDDSRNMKLLCGGVLIANEWVLSAAHCFDNVNHLRLRVSLGVYDRRDKGDWQTFHVRTISIHPHYRLGHEYNHDIALLRLSTAVSFTENSWPICLPSSGATVSPGTKCVVSGWGLNHHGIYPWRLSYGEVNIISLTECNKTQSYNGKITASMICAQGQRKPNRGTLIDACDGDSGGPLACVNNKGYYELMGLVSFGSQDACGQANEYGVYSRVPQYIDWIQESVTNAD
jgi:secreted trypsin-like serine protease